MPQEGRNLNKPIFSSWNACGLPGVGGGAGGNVEAWIDLLIIWRLSWFSYITCFHLEYCYSPWTGLMLIHYRLPLSEAFFSGLFDSLLVSIYTPVKRQRPFHVREKYIAQKRQWDNDLASVKTRELLDPWTIWSLHPCSIIFNDVKFTGYIYLYFHNGNDITLFRLVAETFPNVHLHFKHKLVSANLEEGHLVLSWYDKKLVFF